MGRDSPLLRRTLELVRRHDLLPDGETVVVAVSGGADSVALAVLLAELVADGRTGVRPVAAHLNHGLRAGADEDQAFVEALAEELGMPLEAARVDVASEADATGVGVEEAGRLARHRFFAEVAVRRGAGRVALGHHLEDRAETVLHHVLRGTGIDGLAAMMPRSPLPGNENVDVVRPMLAARREELREFLRERGRSWRQDPTNRSLEHTRNRLRHEVLPLVREAVNPRADEALGRLADQAAAAKEVLDDALERTWSRIVQEAGDGTILVDADDFASLAPWMQGAILRQAIERLGGGLKQMSARRTREAVDALTSGTGAGPVALPGGLAAERTRRAIRIEAHDKSGHAGA